MVSALLTYAATLGFDCGSDGVLRLNSLRCRWPTAPLHIYNFEILASCHTHLLAYKRCASTSQTAPTPV